MPPNSKRSQYHENFDDSEITSAYSRNSLSIKFCDLLFKMDSKQYNESANAATVKKMKMKRFASTKKRKNSVSPLKVVPQDETRVSFPTTKTIKRQHTKPDQCYVRGSELNCPPPTHMAMPLHFIPHISSFEESQDCIDTVGEGLTDFKKYPTVPIMGATSCLFQPALVQPQGSECGMLPPPSLSKTPLISSDVNRTITHFVHVENYDVTVKSFTNRNKCNVSEDSNIDSLTDRVPIKKRESEIYSDKLYDAALALSTLANVS